MAEQDPEALRRAERRRWIKEHHPDTGGDPAEFAAGLPVRRESRGDRPVVRPTRPLKRLLRTVRKRIRTTLRRRSTRRRRVQ